jgi:transposase
MIGKGRGVGRPSVVEPFRLQLAALLEVEPRTRTVEILHRMRQAGYAGGKSVLYEMVRLLRPRDLPALSAFEGLPGVLSQHDFGAVVITYPTGRRERVHYFVSRLRYSRYLDVRLVRNDGIEPLIRSLLAGFEAFGGVPLVAMFHNPRTVILGQDGQRIEWNETFGQVAIDYRFAPELCARGGGVEKGRSQDLVGFVKGSFFKVRRFRNHDDLLVRSPTGNARSTRCASAAPPG